MHKLREMLCDELEKITNKGELSAGSLDVIDKLTHSIKSIDTIEAMEDSGYSRDGMSYARGWDSRGRYYSRDGYSYGEDGSYGYSRGDDMTNLKKGLHGMLEDAKTEEERKMIKKFMRQVED